MTNEALKEFTTDELKLEISRREFYRRQSVKGHTVHDDMLYGEVLDSMIKGGYKVYTNVKGDRWGNGYNINENLMIYALYNVDIFGGQPGYLGILYKNKEFIKDGTEARCSGSTWGYVKEANGWE